MNSLSLSLFSQPSNDVAPAQQHVDAHKRQCSSIHSIARPRLGLYTVDMYAVDVRRAFSTRVSMVTSIRLTRP